MQQSLSRAPTPSAAPTPTPSPWLSFSLIGVSYGLLVLWSLSIGLQLAHGTNADALYIPMLVDDIWRGDGPPVWALTPANYLFPEVILAALFIGPWDLDAQQFLLAQFVLFSVGLAVSAGLVMVALTRQWAISLAIGACSVIVLYGLGGIENSLMMNMWRAGHHQGLIPCGLLLIWITIEIIRRGEETPLSWYAACAVLVGASTFSDLLFAPQFVLPVAFGLTACWFFKSISTRLYVRFLLTAAASFALFLAFYVVVYVLLPFLLAGSTLKLDAASAYASALQFLDDLPTVIDAFWTPARTIWMAVWLGLTCISLIMVLWSEGRRRHQRRHEKTAWLDSLSSPDDDRRSMAIIVTVTCLFSWLGSLSAPIATATWTEIALSRHILPAICMPFLMFAPLAWCFGSLASRIAGGVTAVAALTLCGLAVNSYPKLPPASLDWSRLVLSMQPAQQRMVEIARGNTQPLFVFTDYWNSKMLRSYTDGHVQANAFSSDGTPYFWITNVAWFVKHNANGTMSTPSYQYVMTQNLDEADLIKHFGAPTDIEDFEQHGQIWFYEDGLDQARLDKRLAQTMKDRKAEETRGAIPEKTLEAVGW